MVRVEALRRGAWRVGRWLFSSAIMGGGISAPSRFSKLENLMRRFGA